MAIVYCTTIKQWHYILQRKRCDGMIESNAFFALAVAAIPQRETQQCGAVMPNGRSSPQTCKNYVGKEADKHALTS